MDSENCIRTLTGHKGDVLSLCTQKKRLYSSSADKTIKVNNLIHSNLMEDMGFRQTRVPADDSRLEYSLYYDRNSEWISNWFWKKHQSI